MRRCQGCGGVLGRDCWNEQECVWIGRQQDNEAYQKASFVPELEDQLLSASNIIEQLQKENARLRYALHTIADWSDDHDYRHGCPELFAEEILKGGDNGTD